MNIKVCSVEIGKKKATGIEVQLPEAPMVLVLGSKGYLMCGYLNLEAAEKFKAVCAVVRGVQNVGEILSKPVVSASLGARRLGVRPGMKGRTALKKFL